MLPPIDAFCACGVINRRGLRAQILAVTSPEDPPEPLPSSIARGRRTRRARAKRGAGRFLGRVARDTAAPSVTPPVAVAAAPPEPEAFEQGAAAPRRARSRCAEPTAVFEPAPMPAQERAFDDADERFFLAEDSLAPVAVADLAESDEAAQRARLDSPRRRAFARGVGAVVLLATGMCVAAFTGRGPPLLGAASSAIATSKQVVGAPVPVAVPVPVVGVPVTAPVPVPSSQAAFNAGRTPAAIDPVAALEARERARRALSKGDVASAVTLATHSVQLDPSEADAWLVLGAAELARGAHTQARSTFRACTKAATRGPRRECERMLR